METPIKIVLVIFAISLILILFFANQYGLLRVAGIHAGGIVVYDATSDYYELPLECRTFHVEYFNFITGGKRTIAFMWTDGVGFRSVYITNINNFYVEDVDIVVSATSSYTGESNTVHITDPIETPIQLKQNYIQINAMDMNYDYRYYHADGTIKLCPDPIPSPPNPLQFLADLWNSFISWLHLIFNI